MEPEVAAVIEELDGHRARFETFCRALNDDELNASAEQSTWLVRDFIAHLATIDGPVTTMFRGVHDGSGGGLPAEGGGAFDIDAWNDHQVEVRRKKSVDELLAEAAEERKAIHEAMAAFSAADLQYVMPFGGDSKRPAGQVRLLDYLRGWCKHDPMHVVDMMRGLPASRMTPEVSAWLDDPIIAGYQRAMNPEG